MSYVCGLAIIASGVILSEALSIAGALLLDHWQEKRRLRKEKKKHDRQRDTG